MRELVLQYLGYNDWSAAGYVLRGVFLDWRFYLLLMGALIVGITVHEFGHAWMADRLGDPQPREQNRVSLSPFAHLDPLGTLLMAATALVGFPIGWGKPVRTDPDYYTCGRRLGIALVSAAGPLMNLLTAIVLSPVARWLFAGAGHDHPVLFAFVIITMLVNLSLFCFNLMPIAPLDGSHITASALPEKESAMYQQFMARYGVFVFLALMFTGVLGKIIGPLVIAIFRFLVGI
jgi:Zn-dependent protease